MLMLFMAIFINKIFHEQGVHELTMSEFDTPYVQLAVRTPVDASDPEDIKQVHALQDQLKIEVNYIMFSQYYTKTLRLATVINLSRPKVSYHRPYSTL